MKKILTKITTLLILICSMFCMASCDFVFNQVKIPEGYKKFENDFEVSFAYPEDWTVTNGSIVIITSPDENENITVTYEQKSNIYKNMTEEYFNENLAPMYSAQGINVQSVTIEQLDRDVTKISMVNSVYSTTLYQTQLIIPSSDYNYCITITGRTLNTTLIDNVYNTLRA